MSKTKRVQDWCVAISLAALFAFTGLANHPLQGNDEPRVAGIAWEMQHTGQWWVPHLAGVPFLEHPPLFYALLGACIKRFGAFDGVARLPGAIASALTMLLVFSLARRVADRSAGLPALLALVGVAGFFRYSHRAVVDPVLMLWVTCGYYAYARAVWGDARASAGWLLGVYLAAALAFWVKGPIGIAAIAVPVACDAIFGRRQRVLFSPLHLVGLPLLVGLCGAWPLVLSRSGGESAVRAFVLDNGWYRIAPDAAAGHYVGGHEGPFWYYLPRVFGQLGWILLFVPTTAAWLWRGSAPPGWSVPALRFLASVFPIGVLLLSIPGTKRGLYLLPFEPPLAVAIGAWIAASLRGAGSRADSAVCSLCARLSRTAPARAPLRVAALAYAAAIAWNVAAVPLTRSGHELGPVARGVGEHTGGEPLLALSLDEGMLGALSFYAGQVPARVGEPDRLAQQIAEREARFVLAPLWLRDRIAADLGPSVAVEQTWHAHGDDYALFGIPRDAPPRRRLSLLDVRRAPVPGAAGR
jgi:4-amino-4-deoxy-L-arabinose transferase-like glycosyltransferase